MKKKIVLFVGEMGVGKTHRAKNYAASRDLRFIEGDWMMGEKMGAAVGKFGRVTREMREDLVERMKLQVLRAADEHERGVVVAQALYKEEDRRALVDYWTKYGFLVVLIWVRAPFWQNLGQLWSRDRGLGWVYYWLASKLSFQKPTMAIVCDNIRGER